MSYLRYLCLFAYSCVQRILFVFLLCLSLSCVSYVASFSGFSIFDCNFGVHFSDIDIFLDHSYIALIFSLFSISRNT